MQLRAFGRVSPAGSASGRHLSYQAGVLRKWLDDQSSAAFCSPAIHPTG